MNLKTAIFPQDLVGSISSYLNKLAIFKKPQPGAKTRDKLITSYTVNLKTTKPHPNFVFSNGDMFKKGNAGGGTFTFSGLFLGLNSLFSTDEGRAHPRPRGESIWRCDMHPAFSGDFEYIVVNGRPGGTNRQVGAIYILLLLPEIGHKSLQNAIYKL